MQLSAPKQASADPKVIEVYLGSEQVH